MRVWVLMEPMAIRLRPLMKAVGWPLKRSSGRVQWSPRRSAPIPVKLWTSGATESDNLAIRGLLEGMANATGRRKIITMETEHKAVLDTCAHLIDAQVVYLKPGSDGLLSLDSLAKVLDDTVLFSIGDACQ